jgi:Sec-independent protein translocase protein TatA
VSSTVVSASELFAIVVVALLVAGSAAIIGLRWLRRRWARLRTLAARHAGRLAREASTAVWRWLWSVQVPDHRWRALHRVRRQLWRAVADTERAVQVASGAEAPLGDLMSLAGRLREAARQLDSSLRIAQRGSGSRPDVSSLSREAEVLLTAAGHIQQSASVTLAATSVPAGDQLLEDARIERAAISAAVASIRTPGSPQSQPFASAVASIAPR